MDFSFLLSAFVAGLLTFLAPCTLPLVPGYLAFVSGVPPSDLNDPKKTKAVRRKILLNGIFFVIGFSIIFIVMGTVVGLIGRQFATYRLWLTRIGGVFVIVFGLFMLDVIKIPFLNQEKRLKMPKFIKRGNPLSSFFLGSAFAFGWTPCVGPVLGAILVLASTTTTVFQGALLLAVFSLGLGVPFIIIAFFISKASASIIKFQKYLKVISVIGGIFIIFLGILLLTNRMTLLISWGFQLLEVFNYDAILIHL